MVKWNDSNNSPSAGVTLIGVLFATLIFTTILIATMNLMGRTMREVGRSREDFIATNLAREGLELIQFARDTNWLSGATSWTGNAIGSQVLCNGSNPSQLIVDTIPSTNNVTGLSTLVRVQPLTNPESARLYLNPHPNLSVNRYEHTPVVGQPPVYSRSIDIDCTNQATSENEHILVTSTVKWQSRGSDHEVKLTTHLYNW